MAVYDALGIKATYASAEPMQFVDTVQGVPFSDGVIKAGIVPDVKGMGLVDALYALENSGYRTKVKGTGKVVTQSLLAGKKAAVGTPVMIELR